MQNERSGWLKWVLALLVLAGVAIYIFVSRGRPNRAVAGIPDPVQTEAKGSAHIDLDGFDMRFNYLYAYDIEALVVSTQKYDGDNIGDKLAPKDLALAWGKVAEYNDRIDFHWSQSGRWYHWSTDSYEALLPVGGVEGVATHSANCHLIATDANVRATIRKIRTGDHVRIRGYLVNCEGVKQDGTYFTWNSSTSREDTGGGACEVIYTTSAEILD